VSAGDEDTIGELGHHTTVFKLGDIPKKMIRGLDNTVFFVFLLDETYTYLVITATYRPETSSF
jgi:hypothetical protein